MFQTMKQKLPKINKKSMETMRAQHAISYIKLTEELSITKADNMDKQQNHLIGCSKQMFCA